MQVAVPIGIATETRSGKSMASAWVTRPPIESPVTAAGPSQSAARMPAGSAAMASIVQGAGGAPV